MATQRCLERYCDDFQIVETTPTQIRIINDRNGPCTNSSDFGTGFTIDTFQEGTEKLIKSIDIPYDGKSRYIYNTQEKRFENFPLSDGTLSGEVDLKNPNSYEIINKQITTKNIEVSQVLPDNTKKYTIYVRDAKAQLRLAFNSGETTSKYKTIDRGYEWSSGDMDIPNSSTIYLLSTQDNIDVEIVVWKRV